MTGADGQPRAHLVAVVALAGMRDDHAETQLEIDHDRPGSRCLAGKLRERNRMEDVALKDWPVPLHTVGDGQVEVLGFEPVGVCHCFCHEPYEGSLS